jgi:pimeloyl-ACP methyl ester carboxylesterase
MLDYVMSGKSPYYTMTELNYYIPGVEKSGEAIAEFAYSYDLPDIISSTTIPVHFMVGEHDQNTAADLSSAYYETLEAPAKSFTVIKDAGHSFLYEKPDEWAATLIKIADETLGN